MNSVYKAHRDFHAAWSTRYRKPRTQPEPVEVTNCRNYFFVQLDRLFNELAKYEENFFNGKPEAIDAILNFLEVDIPAFRCGYAKEKFFRRLKSLPLNSIQEKRILDLAYKLCQTNTYRREFRDLVRLTIKLADKEFVERIESLRKNSGGKVKFKSELLLDTIRNNRKDLL
jgi:hypothetical protein